MEPWLSVVGAALVSALESHARELDAENKKQSASLFRLLEAALAEVESLVRSSSKQSLVTPPPDPPKPPPGGLVMDTDTITE